MKYLATSIAFMLLLAGGFIAVNWPRSSCEINAQDSKKEARATTDPKVSKTDQGSTEFYGDRPYPTFCVDDVIAKLTSSAEEMIKQKLVKNSNDLRKHLDRSMFSMTLVPAFSKDLSTQELYRRASESVFLVAGLTRPTEKESDWHTSFSTAFAVHEDGILSTSAHVFDHEDHDDAVVVLDVQGNVYPVLELLAADRKADTLLFRIGKKGLKPLPLGKDAAPGSVVRVMGHPGDSFFYFSAGHLANYERDDENISWLNVTADFGQGSSGGPVMDEAGNVIGQVSRTYTLYAGGESSNRRRRTDRQRKTVDPKSEAKDVADDETSDSKKEADPQMVFKACTPVSAIRALVK